VKAALPELRLIRLANSIPEKRLGNEHFGQIADSAAQKRMFQGTRHRHHMEVRGQAVDHFEIAAKQLGDLSQVDAILTNVSLPDEVFTGCGAVLAQRLKLKPPVVVDYHSGGCISFVILLEYAQALMASHGIRQALVCVGQTSAGRIFGHEKIRKKPQAAVPGDGFSVVLVGRSDTGARLEGVLHRCHPEFAADMAISFDDGRKYWEPGLEPGYIDFPEGKITSIIMRGNRLVPDAMRSLRERLGIRNSEISGLVTNQPNPFFLRNWREALELPAERHFDTFEKYGNLFQAGIPITLSEAIETGRIEPGSRIFLAGFSHAGDYSGAASLLF
jgi:3-oxoacyl-[acyl-carrier-protein] synthase-3